MYRERERERERERQTDTHTQDKLVHFLECLHRKHMKAPAPPKILSAHSRENENDSASSRCAAAAACAMDADGLNDGASSSSHSLPRLQSKSDCKGEGDAYDFYTCSNNDTLELVSKRSGVPVQQLLGLNKSYYQHLTKTSKLRANTLLRLNASVDLKQADGSHKHTLTASKSTKKDASKSSERAYGLAVAARGGGGGGVAASSEAVGHTCAPGPCLSTREGDGGGGDDVEGRLRESAA
jgi:hypothetical protein